MILAGVIVAGACGAVLRYLVDHSVQKRAAQRRSGSAFPVGTLAVNVTGSLALGLLSASALHHGVSAAWLTVAGTGFIGAYTTFSTFAFDTVRLAEADRWRPALVNVALSLGLGLAAAAIGLVVGSAL